MDTVTGAPDKELVPTTVTYMVAIWGLSPFVNIRLCQVQINGAVSMITHVITFWEISGGIGFPDGREASNACAVCVPYSLTSHGPLVNILISCPDCAIWVDVCNTVPSGSAPVVIAAVMVSRILSTELPPPPPDPPDPPELLELDEPLEVDVETTVPLVILPVARPRGTGRGRILIFVLVDMLSNCRSVSGSLLNAGKINRKFVDGP
jgi:hypothetical protein